MEWTDFALLGIIGILSAIFFIYLLATISQVMGLKEQKRRYKKKEEEAANCSPHSWREFWLDGFAHIAVGRDSLSACKKCGKLMGKDSFIPTSALISLNENQDFLDQQKGSLETAIEEISKKYEINEQGVRDILLFAASIPHRAVSQVLIKRERGDGKS